MNNINRPIRRVHYSNTMTTDFIAKVAMLAALSTVIATISMPLPFAPSFYKLEISDSVILLGGFFLGPVAVSYMQLFKILLSFFITGTVTSGVGELASFLMGLALCIPASIIYQMKRGWKSAIIGLLAGTVFLGVVSGLLNYYFLIPAYSKGFNLPMEALIGMGTSVNESILTLEDLILYATVPFNIVKALVNSAVTLVAYQLILLKRKM